LQWSLILSRVLLNATTHWLHLATLYPLLQSPECSKILATICDLCSRDAECARLKSWGRVVPRRCSTGVGRVGNVLPSGCTIVGLCRLRVCVPRSCLTSCVYLYISQQPCALAGLTPAKDPIFESIGLTCIKDLGEWKYYRRFRLNYSRGLHMCYNCTNCAQAALCGTSETCKCQGWAKAICALAEVESENGSS